VVHYEPSNVLLMTGRAAVIKRLLTIVERVDNAGDRSVVTVPLLGLRRGGGQTGYRTQ
jgi:general secretion pathway protein D